MTRREALGALGAAVGGLLAACGGSPTSATSTSTTTSNHDDYRVVMRGDERPKRPAYPDILGMLSNPAFNRRDVTEGKAGRPDAALTIVNANASCAPSGPAFAVRRRRQLLGVFATRIQRRGPDFLRGVQTTDASGQVTFTTIYPGWFRRATHIHVEIYVNGRSVKVTQVAFPESISSSVYASGVSPKGQNTTSNARQRILGRDEHRAGDRHRQRRVRLPATPSRRRRA